MKSDFVEIEKLPQMLNLVTPKTRLICEVALATGLRIGDVVALKSAPVMKQQRITVREQKTGKSRRIYLRRDLLLQMRNQAGERWVFEGRKPEKHHTRQAVWKALKKAAKDSGVSANFTPHSLRKIYAVRLIRKGRDLKFVSRRLGHSSEFVTMIYALADILAQKKR